MSDVVLHSYALQELCSHALNTAAHQQHDTTLIMIMRT